MSEAPPIASTARQAATLFATGFEIKNRWTGAVLYRSDTATDVRSAVIEAIAADANLTRANLTDANLTDANLTDADLTPIEADLRLVLALAGRQEVAGLLAKLREGQIDGSAYEGKCACLVGTIANLRGCNYASIPGLAPNARRLSERWFLAIQPGCTPQNSAAAKVTESWIESWLAVNPEVAK